MAAEEFLLDNQLCFRLYTASRLLTQAYHPLLSAKGLTYPQYLVLLVLWEKDAQPVNDIAKRLLLETNTVTPLLKRMEAEGILTRRKGEKDARQMIVSLTPKAKRTQRRPGHGGKCRPLQGSDARNRSGAVYDSGRNYRPIIQ